MKYLFVLSEYRKPRISAEIGRGKNSEQDTVYLVTVSRRFPTLEAAKAYFLKEVSAHKKERERMEAEIDYNDRLTPKAAEYGEQDRIIGIGHRA